MKILFLVLAVLAVLAAAKSEDARERFLLGNHYLKVKTSNGYVQGYEGRSCRTRKPFVGFRGIPYAEPPLGELRFRDPAPFGTWEGVWNATFQRPSCIQEGVAGEEPSADENGFSEDCLYLNVYTPNVNYLKFGLAFPKAVMLFIHPGAFTVGSSSEAIFAPDFLIDQDVVVVTFNYRLGALGFLSFQNELVPGNAGLKDQNLVLRWVKQNIKHFGGDPSRITIFGESAGSASVNFHMLSPASAGLFNYAIMESGTAITPWAYSPPEMSLKKAKNLAKKVGCNQRLETNPDELLKCLQGVPAELIGKYQQKALTLEELFSLRVIAFHPTTEPNVSGAFLTAHPFDLMYSGKFTKVPSIIGSTADEGLLVYPTLTQKDPKGYLLTLLGMDLSRFAPYHFHLKPFTKQAIMVHRQISRFYFDCKTLTGALINNALELLTDVMFTLPIQLTSSLLADNSVPVYNYLFSYDGGYNVMKAATDIMNVSGVSHGDDLGYLFYTRDLHTECGRNRESPDEVMIDRMTKMWANFAKNGNPTPDADCDPKDKWLPFTSTERNYYDIGKYLVPSEGLKLANMVFWDQLIKELMETVPKAGSPEIIDDLEILS